MVFSRKFKVKNTTIFPVSSVFELLFPPLCRGCGAKGAYLCECCKKYILENTRRRREGEVEFLGFRDEILGELVEEFKYQVVKGAGRELAEVVLTRGLDFNKNGEKVVVVPFPTNRRHVRERGLDHMDYLARQMEKMSGGGVERRRLLVRAKDTVQVGASEEARKKQAKEAVKIDLTEVERLKNEGFEGKVVLIDDVWTTGASMKAGLRMLKKAGVEARGLVIVKNRRERSPVIYGGEFEGLSGEQQKSPRRGLEVSSD